MTRAVPIPERWTHHRKGVASLEFKTAEDVLVVGGFTELTAASTEPFGRQICAALSGHTAIEIDLSQTNSMDCAGLGALIALRKVVRGQHGVMRLVNPTPPVRQLLELLRAGQLFEIVNLRPANRSSISDNTAFPPARITTAAAVESPAASQVEAN